jgi:hypothetical protein
VTRIEFINTIKGKCQQVGAKYHIPWQWLTIQAIQESGGYGLSDLSKNAKNLYGIKGDEYYQGSVGYAKFRNWDEAIEYQGWQLNVPRYAKYLNLVQAGRFKEYGDAIQLAGWCKLPDPGEETYGTMIAAVAKMHGLEYTPPKLSVAQQWAADNGIVNNPDDFVNNPSVDLNRVVWILYKARGKM